MFDFGELDVDLITSSTCRLCLKNIGNHSIFEIKENGNSLAEMLISITSLTDFSRENGYPESVCSSCSRRIEDGFNLQIDCVNLKADCEKSEKIIERLFLNICVKEEEQIVEQSCDVEVPKPIKEFLILKEEELDVDIINELGPTDVDEGEQYEEESEVFDESDEFLPDTYEEVEESDEFLSSDDDEIDDEDVPTKSTKITKTKTNHSKDKMQRRYPCDKCGNTFANERILREHDEQFHLGVKYYKCEICKKEFYHIHEYNIHVRIHSDKKPFKCDHCDKAYLRKKGLKKHSVVHGTNPYKCQQCNESFAKQNELNEHKTNIHGIEKIFPYKCNYCDKTLSRKDNLIKHMNIHTGTGFKCKICDKVLSSKDSLIKHSFLHADEKSFKCQHCNLGFNRTSNLYAHERTHTGGKKHPCLVCKKEFTRNSCMRKHMNRKHGNKAKTK